MNHGEIQNRILKASRFVDFIDRHCPDLADSFEVGRLLTKDWEQITDLKNTEAREMAEAQEDASELPRGSIEYQTEHVPSFETRAAIVGIYRSREAKPMSVTEIFQGLS